MFVEFVKEEIFAIEPIEQEQTNATLEPSLGAIEFFESESKLSTSSASKYVHVERGYL